MALVTVLGQCPHVVRKFLRVLASGVIPIAAARMSIPRIGSQVLRCLSALSARISLGLRNHTRLGLWVVLFLWCVWGRKGWFFILWLFCGCFWPARSVWRGVLV